MIRLGCTLKLLLLSAWLFGQTPAETFQFGQRALQMQNFALARLAFERLLFFEQDSFAFASASQLGQIARAESKFPEAITWFGRAAILAPNDMEKAGLELQKAAVYLRMNDPMMGQALLLGLPENLPDSLLKYQAFLMGVSYFMQSDFTQSQQAFKKALSINDQAGLQKLDSLFGKLARIKHPKPNLARLLSIIIPGAGQFYAGDIKNGLNSLLLTGGFLTLGIYSMLFYTPFDAIVAIAPWFQRYYMGGYKRAGMIAADRLNQKQNQVFMQILACFNSSEPKSRQ